MSLIVKRIAAIAVTAIVGMGAIAPSFAGEADIKFRQNVMKASGAHAGVVGAVMKGQIKDEASAFHHAIALHETAQSMAAAWSVNSPGGRSLPAIWEKPDAFKADVAAFVAATGKAADAAKAKDMGALKVAFGAVGKNCGSCHGSYRAKKK
jgi:cytochrome c556